MTETYVKTPWHLWLVGLFAVLFNAIGVFDFSMSRLRGAEYMASAGMTPQQIALYLGMPGVMTIVWAIGVYAAFAASLLLLLRRSSAFAVFAISLAAFVVNMAYLYAVADGGVVLGQQMAVTSVVIAALLAFFAWYSRAMAARGVLR
jgi:hypothetical protein